MYFRNMLAALVALQASGGALGYLSNVTVNSTTITLNNGSSPLNLTNFSHPGPLVITMNHNTTALNGTSTNSTYNPGNLAGIKGVAAAAAPAASSPAAAPDLPPTGSASY
jgi:hypothetical protein